MPSPWRMLVVDDDPAMRMSLSQQFEAEDFAVDSAADGIPALALINKNSYDVILLDLNLPRMNGVALMKELNNAGKVPTIIVLTASNSLLRAVECVKLGAKSYLLKPYDPGELLSLVMKSIASEKPGT